MAALSLDDGKLSQAQVDRYWDEGYLFPVQVFASERAQAYRATLEEIEETWLSADLPKPLNTYKRVGAHVTMPFIVEISKTPAILDAVEGILGPDIMIYSAELFIKEPRTSHVVTMHQDLTYWGLGAIDGLVTAWVALSPATVESGCMDFVRSSHKNSILPHEDTFGENNLLSRGQEIKVDVDEEDKTAIVLQPGQMSLHHGLTIHGSGPNVSDDRRIGVVIRYIRPDMEQQVGARDFAMMARGEDRFGHFEHVPEPKDIFASESLSLYEEIRAEQAKVLMRDSKAKSEMYS